MLFSLSLANSRDAQSGEERGEDYTQQAKGGVGLELPRETKSREEVLISGRVNLIDTPYDEENGRREICQFFQR